MESLIYKVRRKEFWQASYLICLIFSIIKFHLLSTEGVPVICRKILIFDRRTNSQDKLVTIFKIQLCGSQIRVQIAAWRSFGKSAPPGESQNKPSWNVCLSRAQVTFKVDTGSSLKLKASWQILPQPERLLSLLSDCSGKCLLYPETSGMEGRGEGGRVQCSCSH